MMQRYKVVLTGTSSLIMHSDDIGWAEQIKAYRESEEGQQMSVKGDDRSPPWTWIGALYHDEKFVAMPLENIMRCMMEAGAMVPTGQGKKTFKSQTQSGCMPESPYWQFLVNGKQIPMDQINKLVGVKDFNKHVELAQGLGFNLFVKRAKIGAGKHIRVRPMFGAWSTEGTLLVTDEQLTLGVLKRIFDYAGRYKGLCDWRPGSKTPGAYGMFTSEVTAI